MHAMGEFSSTSTFRVSMLTSDGTTERVKVQIGLDGLKISDASTGRAMRSYDLGHISRWQSRGSSLVLYTRTPVDVEERQLTLQGDEYTIRGALDTLTCCCMQLAELLQSKGSTDAQETANSLHALVAGDGKKKTKLPSADDVEYWREPAMEGWLQSQGEHIKSWRKRWFVLKQGYLFRFMNNNVSESSKPRGVVDLSKIQDVSQATKITGKPFSFQLKTATGGSVCYLCDSETDLVMWMSAVQREVEKIVKKLAGVEEEQAPASRPASKAAGQSSVPSEWMKQLEKNFESLNTTGGNTTSSKQQSSSSRYGGGPAMVEVVGYETMGGGGGGSDRHDNGSRYQAYDSNTGRDAPYGSGLNYGNIAGAGRAASGGLSQDTLANYGDRSYGRAAGGYTGGGNDSSSYGSGAYAAQGSYSTGNGYGASHGYGSGAYASNSPSAYGSQQQGYAQHPASAAATVSLIDAVPQSQPAYPYYQQGMPQAASVSGSQAQWQVHHTAEGRPYYYNTQTGTTQWEAPAGM